MSEIKQKEVSEEFVVFRTFSSINEAEIIKSVLDSYGIWTTINNEYMSAIYPMAISSQLIIRKEEYEKAIELIND
ncbi:MAG: DUF2007 domain-containing protein [Rikenellaceae bacterium]